MSKETEVKINEYQEGIGVLKNIRRVPSIFIDATVERLVSIFQPLVDKATPKKPTNITLSTVGVLTGECPICGITVVEFRGCSKCLQAIDWSNDE